MTNFLKLFYIYNMSKAGFSIADLQQGAKKLNTVEVVADSKSNCMSCGEADSETLIALGNVKLLFITT